MTDLFDRARVEGTPLIDGEKVTFVWRGPNPPVVIGDFNDWDVAAAPQLSKIGPNLWAHTAHFPNDAYVEYLFSRRVNPPRPKGEEVRLPDPLNKRKIAIESGKYNHFFYMPGAQPHPARKRPREGVQGTLTRHAFEHPHFLAGGKRAVEFYRPASKGPCPLLVVYDGADYVRRGQIIHVVENLIAAKRIRPLALALLANSKQARVVEYGASDITLAFLRTVLLPWAQKELNLVDPEKHAGAYGALGASIGGLMALYTGLRLPQVFGQVFSQSGTFALGPQQEMVVFDLVREGERRPLKIYQDVGRMEQLLEANRRMHTLLQKRGYTVTYHEYNRGHNFNTWADGLAPGLEALFS